MSRLSERFHTDIVDLNSTKQPQVTATTRECASDCEDGFTKPMSAEAFIVDEAEGIASGTESTVEEFGRQDSNLSTPAMELSEPTPTLSLLSALARYKGKSRDALSALERFALNAMVESYCAQRVSLHLPANVSHQTHEACKAELYSRVSRILGIDGGFSREEFKATRISVMEEISQLVESELLIMAGHSTHPTAFITPSPQPPSASFDAQDKSVVRRMSRQPSFERLAPSAFAAPQYDGIRPSTSDGRKPRGNGMYNAVKTEKNQRRENRRPELTRALSYDTLHHSKKGGTRTPPMSSGAFSGGTSAFFGYKSPQQSRSPSTGGHPFRPRPFGHPSTPNVDQERFPSKQQSARSYSNNSSSHISNMGAIRASRSLHRMQQPQPMDQSFQNALAISTRPKTPTTTSFLLSSAIARRASRYASDYVELDFLGKGGFASVYKAKNRVDGRIYAVKKVPIRNKHLNSTNQDRLEGIFRESKALSRLEHQNVVRYFSAWVEGADGLWGQGNTGTFFSRTTLSENIEPSIINKVRQKPEGLVNKLFHTNNSLPSGITGDDSIDTTTSLDSESEITMSTDAPVEDDDTSDDMGIVFGEDSQDVTEDKSRSRDNSRRYRREVEATDSLDDSTETEKQAGENSSDEDSQDMHADDGLGIVFGEDTQDESAEMESRDDSVADDSDDEEDSLDGDVTAEEEDDDIEDIPRVPFHPTDIPLPESPYFPPSDYFRERRRSFVSAVDEDGNELPFAEAFTRASGSSEGEVEQSIAEALRTEAKKRQAFIQTLREKNLNLSTAKNVTVLDPTENLDESKAEDQTEENSSSYESSEPSITATHKKPAPRSAAPKLKPSRSMLEVIHAEKLAKKRLDRVEVLTLMILMSCHPLTLKDFLGASPTPKSQCVTPSARTPYGSTSGNANNTHRSEIEHIKHCRHLQGSLRLFKGILDGVEYLHRKGIVHRDLKPGNIFLDIEGQLHAPHLGKDGSIVKDVAVDECGYCGKDTIKVIPRIGDFGLVVDLVEGMRKNSSSAGEGSGSPGSVSTPGTDYPEEDDVVRGGVVGTALYRPPPCTVNEVEDVCSSSEGERIGSPTGHQAPTAKPRNFPKQRKDGNNHNNHQQQRKADQYKRNIICPKTDVFALGIILFELIYHFETASERVRCIMSLRDQRILPKDWDRVVLKASGGDHGGGTEAKYTPETLKKLGDCVLGMTEPRRAKRWGLKRVIGELRALGLGVE